MSGIARLVRISPPFPNKHGGIIRYSARFFAGKGAEVVEQPQTSEEVLRKWGCDDTQVTSIFQRDPPLRKAVATKLESKLDSLSKLGVSSSDLVKIIHKDPLIIHCQLNKNFDEHLDRLRSLFGSDELLVKGIVQNPSLLIYKLCEEVEPVFELYEQMGVAKHDLISMFLLRPTLIPRTKMCEEKLDYIRRTGVTKESKMFKYVVTIIGVSRIDAIREKIANLAKFGIAEDEVLQCFGRNPFLMNLSTDKVQQNMTFVVGTMKLPPTAVLKYAHLLSANLENVLKPRGLLARKIQEMGLEPQMTGSLMFTALTMTEERFLKVFVAPHEKDVRQELLAYYAASKGIKRSAASSKNPKGLNVRLCS